MTERVENITLNSRYKVTFEKSASANKIDGFSVTAHGDDMAITMKEAATLYMEAIAKIEANKPATPPSK